MTTPNSRMKPAAPRFRAPARATLLTGSLLTGSLLGGALLMGATAAASPGVNSGSAPASLEIVTVNPSKVLPPGMAALKGGRVTMGTTPKEIEGLMKTAADQQYIRLLDGETPQHRSKVDPFALGIYEVTNEQYLEYVKSMGVRPPENWAGEALGAAIAAFQKAEAEAAMAATKEGRKYDRRKWGEADKNAWWRDNWQDVDWSIPKGQEAMPVCYVDYDDAVGYARWAGLRLPTEEEWVYAARADDKKIFPWGDEWDATDRAHTSEIGSEKPRPVGSFAKGVTESGIQDMAGSVWEWTTSPYNKFDRFKPNTYTFKKLGGKEKVTPEARWNPSFRIIKGGSPQLPLLAARIATRQGAKRSQTTNAVGFRAASSVTPGVDKATAIWETTVQPSQARTQGEVFDFAGVVALDRWHADTPENRAPNYSVIKSYDYVLFAPRNEFETKPGAELKRESRKQPVILGIFATTVPILEPAIPPGNYFVSYREKGRMTEAEPEEEGEDAKKAGDEGEEEEVEVTDDTPLELLTPAERLLRLIDLKKDLIIFSTADTGEYVASMDTTSIKTDVKATKADDGEIILSKKVAFDENKEKIQEDWMKIKANIRSSSSRVIGIQFDLKIDGAAMDGQWRTKAISATGK